MSKDRRSFVDEVTKEDPYGGTTEEEGSPRQAASPQMQSGSSLTRTQFNQDWRKRVASRDSMQGGPASSSDFSARDSMIQPSGSGLTRTQFNRGWRNDIASREGAQGGAAAAFGARGSSQGPMQMIPFIPSSHVAPITRNDFSPQAANEVASELNRHGYQIVPPAPSGPARQAVQEASNAFRQITGPVEVGQRIQPRFEQVMENSIENLNAQRHGRGLRRGRSASARNPWTSQDITPRNAERFASRGRRPFRVGPDVQQEAATGRGSTSRRPKGSKKTRKRRAAAAAKKKATKKRSPRKSPPAKRRRSIQ